MTRFSLALAFTLTVAAQTVSAQSVSSSGPGRGSISAPKPEYPYEARASHLTGSGVVLVQVDTKTGYVASARMLKSTGHRILDEAALKAFRKWRFKPGTVHEVHLPIRYTMSGKT
jgi:TonB family protein